MSNDKKNEIETGLYSFTDKNIFGQSLIHLINLNLPKDPVIVELGTGYGTTACMIAQHCPNIKKIYTVDPYIPYTTSWVGNGMPFGKKEIDNAKIIAKHNVEFSGFKEKIELLNIKSDSALSMFDDESIDLLFYDATQTVEIAYKDIFSWYKKIKRKGIISGHCWGVLNAGILKFKNTIDSDSVLSVYDDVWVWQKK
jgi:predicted O-methyltransferase YrrM